MNGNNIRLVREGEPIYHIQEDQAPTQNASPTLPKNPIQPSDKPIRATCIQSEGLGVFGDEAWMAAVTDVLGVAANSSRLLSTNPDVVRYTPILGAIGTPFYLYHAIKEAGNKFKMLATAFKTSEYAEMFFWAGKSAAGLGVAVSTIAKPISTAVTLLGLTQIPAVGMTFLLILPVVLIALSSIGAITQTWSLARTGQALHTFNKKQKSATREEFLHHLLNPLLTDAKPLSEMQKIKFTTTHFIHSARQPLMHQRIGEFLGFEETEVKQALASLTPLLREGMRLTSATTAPPLQRLEETITLCQGLIEKANKLNAQTQITELQNQLNDLQNLQAVLLKEGNNITGAYHSEISRALFTQILCLCIIALSLSVSILSIASPGHRQLIYALGLTTATLDIFRIIFNKSSSTSDLKQSQEFERYRKAIE